MSLPFFTSFAEVRRAQKNAQKGAAEEEKTKYSGEGVPKMQTPLKIPSFPFILAIKDFVKLTV